MAAEAFVDLTAENINQHHLCCALGDPKHEAGVEAKKVWLKRRFREGLVFRKLDVRGKVFIEYMPSEYAWRPIVAPGWLTIHCLWVSGRFAGKGYGRRLVESALDDASGRKKHGVVVATAKRKRPFLSDPKFLKHLGFEVVDEAGEYRLFAARVLPGGATPRFARAVQRGAMRGPSDGDFRARYTDQCPFNRHWAEEMAGTVRTHGYDVAVERVTTRKKAQGVASPLGTFGLERDGSLITHHLQTTKATGRLVEKLSQ